MLGAILCSDNFNYRRNSQINSEKKKLRKQTGYEPMLSCYAVLITDLSRKLKTGEISTEEFRDRIKLIYEGITK